MTLVGKMRKRRGVGAALVVALIVMILAGVVLIQYSLDRASAQAGWKDSTPFNASRSILDVLGGVRDSLAAVLWSRTDSIYHGYLGGDISKDVFYIPYQWLITRLNPHFAIAYYYASYILCRLGKVQQGFDLALEGVRNNPDSSELQENLAEIYIFFKRDPTKALYHINKAIRLRNRNGSGYFVTPEYDSIKKMIEGVASGRIKLPALTSLENLKKNAKEQGENSEKMEEQQQSK